MQKAIKSDPDQDTHRSSNIVQISNILDDYKDVLSPADVKKVLGIGRNAVYDFLSDGTIRSLKIRGKYRIPKLYLLQFMYPDLEFVVNMKGSTDVTTEERPKLS